MIASDLSATFRLVEVPFEFRSPLSPRSGGGAEDENGVPAVLGLPNRRSIIWRPVDVTTSKKVAKQASKELKTQTTKSEKAVAASDLSQAKKKVAKKRGR